MFDILQKHSTFISTKRARNFFGFFFFFFLKFIRKNWKWWILMSTDYINMNKIRKLFKNYLKIISFISNGCIFLLKDWTEKIIWMIAGWNMNKGWKPLTSHVAKWTKNSNNNKKNNDLIIKYLIFWISNIALYVLLYLLI